jgi:predicted phosphodiesterase
VIGFLSDAHGNSEAFGQAVSLLRSRGAEDIYFLGDAVGYLPGDAVIDALRDSDAIPILGNHDRALVSRTIDPALDHIHRIGETLATVTERNLEFLAGWPEERVVTSRAGTLLLVHGSPQDHLYGYVHADTDLAPFADVEARYVFLGQTHRPFVRDLAGITFVNVGSCGLPRDCGHLGAACLFDDATGDVEILRFDIAEATRAALDRCGPVAPEVTAVLARRSQDCDEH